MVGLVVQDNHSSVAQRAASKCERAACGVHIKWTERVSAAACAVAAA